jgi:hypothetical protein
LRSTYTGVVGFGYPYFFVADESKKYTNGYNVQIGRSDACQSRKAPRSALSQDESFASQNEKRETGCM